MQCEAVLLGREAVGAVDAPAVAALIRTLLQARERVARAAGDLYRDRRRYVLRCGNGLEIAPCPRPTPASATASPAQSASPAPSSASSGSSTRPRRADDEGFESDDDTASTKSAASLDDTVSNSSSCCFVDDHVFKFGPSAAAVRGVVPSASSNSSVATDSANSSGASDTDDVDSSGAPSPGSGQVSKLVKSLTLYQRAATAPPAPMPASAPPTRPEGEVYPLTDIAFCHLDPAFPKVVVWVVKRKRPQRLSATPDGNNTGLQAIVFECANERALKTFCANFQEMSRRAKLDQYKHPHRRKDTTPAFATLYRGYLPSMRESPREKPTPEMQIQAVENPKVVKLELELSKASDTKTINSPRIQKAPPKTLPKPAPPPVVKDEELPVAAKFNLVQRTDGDGVTHIEVARGSSDASSPSAPRIETLPETASGPSSIISISTPDVGNLLTTSAGSQRSSRLGKEIEGVIRSDVDASSSRREPPRQRQPAILVLNGDAVEELHKVWSPPEAVAAMAVAEEDDEDQKDVVVGDPPQRPERRKFVRKKNPAPQPPVPQLQQQPPPPRVTPSPDPFQKKPLVPYKPESLSRGQKIVRGQFIRVSVDQSAAPVQHPWIFGSNYASGGWGGTDPIREHVPRRGLDDMFAIQGHSIRQHPHRGLQHRRSRSTGGRSRSKSPPMTRRPMAYRYIDVANPPPPQPQPPTAGRFFGLSQKLKELSGGGGQGQQVHPGYATTARRRGSIGEASHLAAMGGQGCHLKSVIKKSKRAGEYVEPKKVTFSAYATVQVVD